MFNKSKLEAALEFMHSQPFDHAVVDGFLDNPYTQSLAISSRFHDPSWIEYKSEVQVKRTCNSWNVFSPAAYKLIQMLLNPEFCAFLSDHFDCPIYPDYGLHGGGWHATNNQGILKPHLDYSLHPKMFMQRKLNLIIYLTHDMEESWGGHLGLWEGTPTKPEKLFTEIAPKFNRAVLFDTTQNSWHGMSRPLEMPVGVWRLSLAVYYLCQPADNMVKSRTRAEFYHAPA